MIICCPEEHVTPKEGPFAEMICPDSDWKEFNNHCYYLPPSYNYQSFAGAVEYCRDLAGSAWDSQLASIHSQAEKDFILENGHTPYLNHWIGLKKESTSKDAWINLEDKYLTDNAYNVL